MKIFALFITSMRPRQWIKNLIIFAGILFAQDIFDGTKFMIVITAFAVFCVATGSVYVINDILDIKRDQLHPRKSLRPIASGKLAVRPALFLAAVMVILSLAVSTLLGTPFLLIVLGYLLLQGAYSIFLKRLVIIDIFALALGYVLRVVAGALVIRVEMSSWLIVCAILLSLFISLGKRRHELMYLEDSAESHRSVLGHYSLELLDQMIAIITASTVLSYTLYTVAPETVEKFGTRSLIYTVPFVLYGIFRYLYLIHKRGEGGAPESILISDFPLLADILLWVLTVGAVLYL